MALFKALSGNRANLPEEKHDGYVYFCEDDGSFHVDYKDAAGALQRKQINAKDAETLCGMTLDEIKTHVAVQPDWAQNDEAAADYIKNKPSIPTKLSDLSEDDNHRTVTLEEKTKLESAVTTTEFNEAIARVSDVNEETSAKINELKASGGVGYTELSNSVELIAETQYSNAQEAVVPTVFPNEGDQITLYIDGVANVRTAKAVSANGETAVYIGNVEDFGLGVTGTDDSFGLAFVPAFGAAFCVLADEETHTISCYAQQTIVHTIDEKYLEAPPIITQTDIENGISFEVGEKIEQRLLAGKTPFVVKLTYTDDLGNTDIGLYPSANAMVSYFIDGQKGIVAHVVAGNSFNSVTFTWGETNIAIATTL